MAVARYRRTQVTLYCQSGHGMDVIDSSHKYFIHNSLDITYKGGTYLLL